MYEYQIGDEAARSFRAAAETGPDAGFRFVVYGDMGESEHKAAKAPGCALVSCLLNPHGCLLSQKSRKGSIKGLCLLQGLRYSSTCAGRGAGWEGGHGAARGGHRYASSLQMPLSMKWAVCTCFRHGLHDAAYANGDIAIWDTFMGEVEPYAASVPYMIGIGNHEACTSSVVSPCCCYGRWLAHERHLVESHQQSHGASTLVFPP